MKMLAAVALAASKLRKAQLMPTRNRIGISAFCATAHSPQDRMHFEIIVNGFMSTCNKS